jgi:hypothetical protein
VFGLYSHFIPKCQGGASTAFLIPFSSGISLGPTPRQVKNQLDCSRSIQAFVGQAFLPVLDLTNLIRKDKNVCPPSCESPAINLS